MNDKKNVLNNLKVGQRIAEEEIDELESYFLETSQWKELEDGEIDVVYGPKGSGKSALYTLLTKKRYEFLAKNILLIPGENPRGDTVFKSLVTNPAPSELEFEYLWKLYILSLIANALRVNGVKNEKAKILINSLVDAGILPASGLANAIFKSVKDYLTKWVNRDKKSIEHAITLEPTTMVPIVTRKVEFSEADQKTNLEKIPVDELFECANEALILCDHKIWVLFDRLDIAFVDSAEVERNALRALFRTYNYLKGYNAVILKIFVRDDVWNRIVEGGFTEASHITKNLTIKWDLDSLLNLIILRFIKNKEFNDYFSLNAADVLKTFESQKEVFYRLAPKKILSGKNPDSFEWIISRITDASGNSAPRELIHFFENARKLQIKRIEEGKAKLENEEIFEKSILKTALNEVSKVRYEQTLLAEYPSLKNYIEKLKNRKAEQSIKTLVNIWKVPEEDALQIANRLIDVGFFKSKKSSYIIPFIYRIELGIIQGKEK